MNYPVLQIGLTPDDPNKKFGISDDNRKISLGRMSENILSGRVLNIS